MRAREWVFLAAAGAAVACGPASFEPVARQDEAPQTPGTPAAGDDAPACVPRTCAEVGAGCGTVSDGCYASLDCGTCGEGEWCGGAGTELQCGAPPAITAPVWLTVREGTFQGILVEPDESVLAAVIAPDGSRFAQFSASGELMWTKPHPNRAADTWFPTEPLRASRTGERLVLGRGVGSVTWPELDAFDPSFASSSRVTRCGDECSFTDPEVSDDGVLAMAVSSSGSSWVNLRQADGSWLRIDQAAQHNPLTDGEDPVWFGGVEWIAGGDLVLLGAAREQTVLNIAGLTVGAQGPGLFLLRLNSAGELRGLREYPGIEAAHLYDLESNAGTTLVTAANLRRGARWGDASLGEGLHFLALSLEEDSLSATPLERPGEAESLFRRQWALSPEGEVVATLHHACGGFTLRKFTSTGEHAWDRSYLPEQCDGRMTFGDVQFSSDGILVSGWFTDATVDFGGARHTAAAGTNLGFLMKLDR